MFKFLLGIDMFKFLLGIDMFKFLLGIGIFPCRSTPHHYLDHISKQKS